MNIDENNDYTGLIGEDLNEIELPRQDIVENENILEENKSQVQNDKPSNLIQTVIKEFRILYEGMINQEYRDYCMVKGASEQTIPLVLLVPLGLLLGTTLCLLGLVQNLSAGDPVLKSFAKCILAICAIAIVLYMVLKGCEIIPKVIKNPLLFGRVTTYLIMCAIVFEGIFMLERAVMFRNGSFYRNEFWGTLALIIWQRILIIFIYDFRIRGGFCLFMYTYYAFRVGDSFSDCLYNLYKCCIYVCAEFILIVDTELKNYASYQLEKSIIQTSNKSVDNEQVRFMIPPITVAAQQKILQLYTDIFPIAIFDNKKELLHLSGIMQKQLQLDVELNDNEELDLLQAEIALRKLEIVHVYDKAYNMPLQIKKLKRVAKFGSTCGVNENGELLHSLLHGPALQQLRNGTQAPNYYLGAQQPQEPQQGPRHLNFSSEGLIEKVFNEFIKNKDKEQIQGLVQHKVKPKAKEDPIIKYFQFTLIKNKEQIIMVLEDVTELLNFQNSKQNTASPQDVVMMKELCQKTRAFLASQDINNNTIVNGDILQTITNIECQINIREQSQLHIYSDQLKFDRIADKIYEKYAPLAKEKDIKFVVEIPQIDNFQSDEMKLFSVIDNLLANSFQATDEGLIRISVGPDIRKNCIQVRIEDTGKGFSLESLEKMKSDNPDHMPLGLESSNIIAKMLGPYIMSKQIGGFICGNGLHITSRLGTQIKFSVRNLANDSTDPMYLIDQALEDGSDDESEQDAIAERYIQDKEMQDGDLVFLPRSKKNFKCVVIKQRSEVQIEKPEPNPVVKEKPKLAGMAKLQEQGRMKVIAVKGRTLNTISDANDQKPQLSICQCMSILMVNTSYEFARTLLAQKTRFSWLERVQQVGEQDALRQINRKLKENPCCQLCVGYKYIILNGIGEQFTQQLLQFYQRNMPKIMLLSYKPYGQVLRGVMIIPMPNNQWLESIQ